MPPLILITRPQEGSEAFAAELRAHLGPAAAICVAPLMRIDPADDLPDLAPYRTLIFTSAHGVSAFARATPRRDFTCYTVGDATAAAARQAGFDPITGPGNGRALAAQIRQDAPGQPCLYLRGDHVAFDMARALGSAGIETHQATVYRQVPCPLPPEARVLVEQADPLIVPVFSARSAQLLLDALPIDASLHIGAISDAAARAIPRDRAAVIRVAGATDRSAMLKCVATLWSEANRLESGTTAQ